MEQEFYKKGLLYAIGGLIQKIVFYAAIPISIYHLSSVDLGIIALITIVISILSTTIISPSVNSITRFYYDDEFSNNKEELTTTIFFYSLTMSIALCLLLILLSETISFAIFSDLKWRFLIIIYSTSLIFLSVSSFLLALARISKRTRLYNITTVSSSIVYVVFLLLFFHFHLGIYSLILSQLTSLVFTSIVMLFALKKEFKISYKFKLLKSPFSYSFPLVFSDLSLLLFDSLDRYILNLYTNLGSIGIYDIGYRVSSVFTSVIGIAVNYSLQPIIFENEKDENKIRRFLVKMTTYYLIIAMWIGILLSFVSKEIIAFVALKDKEFSEAAVILPILIFSQILHVLGYFFGMGIILRKKSWAFSGIIFFSFFVNICLNFLLIPTYSLIGAALATFLSYIVWSFLKLYLSKKYYQIKFEINKLIYILIICSFCLGFNYLIEISYISLIQKNCVKVLLIFLYPLLIYCLVLNQDEKIKLKQLL